MATSLPQIQREQAVTFLRTPTARWVDMVVTITHSDDGVEVEARHTRNSGVEAAHFRTRWDSLDKANTEYGHGLSVIHDAKDHVFYGLGFTPLTEIQTIVQTYYGRPHSGGRISDSAPGDELDVIREHIYYELYAPDGRPLVYSQDEQLGTLELYAPAVDDEQKEDAFVHLCTIAEEIMLPPLRAMYQANKPLCTLQASTREQPELVATFLSAINWCDRERLLMRLRDNLAVTIENRAYVNDDLARIARDISADITAYADAHGLVEQFGKIFDTTGYTL